MSSRIRAGHAWMGALSLLCTPSLACAPIVLISPYDQVAESRLEDYREGLNLLVKRAVEGKGSAGGTFESSKESYRALEEKIAGLVARAKMQDQGIGCKLDDKTWTRIKTQLLKAVGLPASNGATGDGSGCVTLMLTNVQLNLASLEGVHKDAAQCGQTGDFTTCLRPKAADDLLAISNDTIDAVLFVEQALKRHEEVK